MCPHTTTIDLALQISARNFSQPFLPSSRRLASEPCVNRTSVLAKTSPPSQDLHRLYTRTPSSRTAAISADQVPRCVPGCPSSSRSGCAVAKAVSRKRSGLPATPSLRGCSCDASQVSWAWISAKAPYCERWPACRKMSPAGSEEGVVLWVCRRSRCRRG
jgi:hypothetical protein